MSECDEYKAPSGDNIIIYKDGPLWYVCCDKDNQNRWTKMYRNEDDAKIEFERWRK